MGYQQTMKFATALVAEAKGAGGKEVAALVVDSVCPVSAFIMDLKQKDPDECERWLGKFEAMARSAYAGERVIGAGDIRFVAGNSSNIITVEEGRKIILCHPEPRNPVPTALQVRESLALIEAYKSEKMRTTARKRSHETK